MKKLFVLLCCFIISISSVCTARVYVKGYYRKDGTYVAPHYRSDPDGIITNNYSYPGNYNPNTGKITGGSYSYYPSTTYSSYSYNTYTPTTTYIKPDLVTAYLPTYPIKVNGQLISNANAKYPFLNYKNVTYLPLTTNVCNALGIGFNFTDNTALLTYSGVCNKSSIDLGISSINPATCKVEKAYAYIGSTYIPAYSEYPFLKYRDIIYMPLTWNNTYAFNLSTYWYTNNGFYLNINK